MKKNITCLNNCYGCGVCVKACPTKIISLKETSDGFYAPIIQEQDKCIDCGLCLRICAFNHDAVAQDNTSTDSYAAWSNTPTVREHCSSGGIGFEIGRWAIDNGYKAVGVRYNPQKNRAEHYIASTVEDYMPSVGSKYIPSYTADAFDKINLKEKYLVTGTPCQIDSFRRLIRQHRKEDNFILLDFFCHGVPSLLLWDKYSAELKEKIGNISYASWRNKSTGWHDSWAINADSTDGSNPSEWSDFYDLMTDERKHTYNSRMSAGDLFYRFFFGHYCLNVCCHKSCKYKMESSAADIRIGDLWGNKYKLDDAGVNVALAFTARGKQVLANIQKSCTLVPEPLAVSTEGQMSRCAPMPTIREKVISQLRSNKTLNEINSGLIFRYNLRFLPARIINKIKRTL